MSICSGSHATAAIATDDNEEDELYVGVLTVSDSCASGEATDTSGQNLCKLIQDGIIPNAKVGASGCVSDDHASIVEALQHWSDERHLHLILTTGGTGFSPRDVTPEAVAEVIERAAPGLSLLMSSSSLRVTPLAALSRPVCGIRGTTIIATLPGSAKAAEECLRFLAPVLPHAIDLLLGRKTKITHTHHLLHSLGVQGAHPHPGCELPQTGCLYQTSCGETMHGNGYEHTGHGHTGHGHHHKHAHHHAHISDGCLQNQHQHHNSHHIHHHSGHKCSSTSSHDSCKPKLQTKTDVSKICRRPRKSPYQMISVDEAQKIIISKCFTKMPITLPLSEAVGFVLAEDITAFDALPPFRASVKDGYAVVAEDGAGARVVMGGVGAGDGEGSHEGLQPGTCIRINTGAPVPRGANAVVQVEDTELVKASEDGCEEKEVKVLVAPSVGQDIRPVGCDVDAGQCVLTKGTLLRPAEIGIAASVGADKVKVYAKPSVGLLSTGNELQAAGSGPLLPGHIRDSNLPTLAALLRVHRVPCVVAHQPARDDPQHLLDALTTLLDQGVDVIVTTGGVSMGDRDILRAVLETDLNVTIHFAQVFMKPGKPTTFGSFVYAGAQRLLLGLPGNPVSATVTAALYLAPLCRIMAGAQWSYTTLHAKLQHRIALDPRPEYHRATLNFSPDEVVPCASSTGNQMSSRLLSCSSAAALLILPARTDTVPALEAGTVVEAILLDF